MESIKAIVTVVGKDHVGIIAGVCGEMARAEINVIEISQTVMDGFFTMMMVVDISACTESFDRLQTALGDYGRKQGLDIRIQREDIFSAMHEI